MKRFLPLAMLLSTLLPLAARAEESEASDKKYNYDFYGFIRTDFFYNSRDNVAGFNDIFYLYPMDIDLDPEGSDLNGDSSSGIFSFITRLGLDLSGPSIGKAKTTGKIEIDFGGYSNNNFLLRLRHAYVNLDWEEKGHQLLIGQSWHPLFGSVMPYMNNVSTGSPYQPFARSPQLRYQYKVCGWQFTAAATYQLQYCSSGPDGNSNSYQMDSGIPELYGGVDYYTESGWQFGGGADLLTLKPRTSSIVAGESYVVNERMSALSGEAHIRYHNSKFNFGAKSIYGSATDGVTMLGGYGVSSISGVNEEQEYTPLHNSTTWVNLCYGTTWRPMLFVGYTKNLGSTEALISADKVYGRGTDIDQLLGINLGLTYNRPSWILGIEGSTTTAWYGDLDLTSGRVVNTHDVTNLRITSQFTYLF